MPPSSVTHEPKGKSVWLSNVLVVKSLVLFFAPLTSITNQDLETRLTLMQLCNENHAATENLMIIHVHVYEWKEAAGAKNVLCNCVH